MIILNTEPTYYLKSEAVRIANDLQKTDPEWQYKILDFCNSGYSLIKVIDEYGQIVGYWN